MACSACFAQLSPLRTLIRTLCWGQVLLLFLRSRWKINLPFRGNQERSRCLKRLLTAYFLCGRMWSWADHSTADHTKSYAHSWLHYLAPDPPGSICWCGAFYWPWEWWSVSINRSPCSRPPWRGSLLHQRGTPAATGRCLERGAICSSTSRMLRGLFCTANWN